MSMVGDPGKTKWESKRLHHLHLAGGAVVKNPAANAGDMGSSSGRGRSHMLQNS